MHTLQTCMWINICTANSADLKYVTIMKLKTARIKNKKAISMTL